MRGLWRGWRAFARATGANIAMMFALSAVPLAIAAGAGLDFASAMMARNDMSDALDAAALAVGASKGTNTALAQSVFNANYKGTGSPTVTPVVSGQSVTITANDTVATTLLALVGKPTLNVSVSTTVVWGQAKLWVSLVLDNTGSMTETDSTGTSKITALKNASHQLLTTLQNASANPGDVMVAIVPFAKDVKVGTSYVNASWIDWTDWNTQYGSAPSTSVGPGSSCPLSLGCVNGPGSTSSVNNVPSSGMICPNAIGSSTTGQAGHYYDGCYNSIQEAKVVQTTTVTPVTEKQTCTTVDSGTASCSVQSGYPSNGTPTNSSTTTYTPNYTGNSTTTNGPTQGTVTTNDGSQSCNTKKGTTTCTWTRTLTYSNTTITTVTSASGIYTHTWVINDHSTWGGCVMDRNQNDDTDDATPGNLFPAENDQSCVAATLMPLSDNWTALGTEIDSMVAGGGTNQTIGLAHGWQTLTNRRPL